MGRSRELERKRFIETERERGRKRGEKGERWERIVKMRERERIRERGEK